MAGLRRYSLNFAVMERCNDRYRKFLYAIKTDETVYKVYMVYSSFDDFTKNEFIIETIKTELLKKPADQAGNV